MAKQMINVSYEVISKLNGKKIIENNGWFDSKESAKKALNKKYPASRCIVRIK